MYPKGFRSYHGVPGTIKECVATLQPPFIATGPVLHWYQYADTTAGLHLEQVSELSEGEEEISEL